MKKDVFGQLNAALSNTYKGEPVALIFKENGRDGVEESFTMNRREARVLGEQLIKLANQKGKKKCIKWK